MNIEQEFQDTELPCIFPYYLNGVLYETCRILKQDDFVFPVNICPIRNITTKINGINSYTADDFNDLLKSYSLCSRPDLQEPGDQFPPLDPNDDSCSFFDRRSSFSRCKNNCIRGNFKLTIKTQNNISKSKNL